LGKPISVLQDPAVNPAAGTRLYRQKPELDSSSFGQNI